MTTPKIRWKNHAKRLQPQPVELHPCTECKGTGKCSKCHVHQYRANTGMLAYPISDTCTLCKYGYCVWCEGTGKVGVPQE